MKEQNLSLGSKPDSTDRIFTGWDTRNRSEQFTQTLYQQLEQLRSSLVVTGKTATDEETGWTQPLVIVRNTDGGGTKTHVIDVVQDGDLTVFRYIVEEKTPEFRSYCKEYEVYIHPDHTVDAASIVRLYDKYSDRHGDVITYTAAVESPEHDMLMEIERDLSQFTIYQAEEVLSSLQTCVDALPHLR